MNYSLKDQLSEWSDFDVTMHAIAASLGLLDNQRGIDWFALKSTYWSKNTVSDGLADIVKSLTTMGALEYDEAEEKWRWNPNFLILNDEKGA